ncbi:hypothetical protein ACFL0U_01535 [Pseudomonadota bacterium]
MRLGSIFFSDETGEAIISALPHNNIETLDLSENELSISNTSLLARILPKSKLKFLDLRSQYDPDDQTQSQFTLLLAQACARMEIRRKVC